ncbi:hydrolase [Ideonella sp. TBM-1]|uniref:Hydrolase n=2 Tax=Ideonella livida TaxID=2707176 RepID=A0A7C9TME3_9BURK|nr:hydrolase [Ideonella livida]
MSFREGLKLTWQMLFDKPEGTRPDAVAPVPVQALRPADLAAAPVGSLWRLGHSTVLLKLEGGFWITDPVFGQRASPVSFAGPSRFHAPPIALGDLPPLAGVILSHDHYDHLDKATVRALAPRTQHFITPTGVGALLVDWGIPAAKVQELGWWQHTTVGGLTLTATPAQHFSGRGLFDRNQRLWCGWALRTAATATAPSLNLFFSGDSGYFDGFKAIGERLGPFDVTLLEAGAYDRRWQAVHMLPEHTVQAHHDLRGRWLLPIHNGTFDLAFHRWTEPLERVAQAAEAQEVPLLTPVFGARVALAAPQPTPAWWRPGKVSPIRWAPTQPPVGFASGVKVPR